MYEKFFGFSERPFDLTSNPKYLFLTPSHREALSNLEYGIAARAGVTVLIGEVGTGKTTLVKATLASHDARKTFPVYLNNPILTRSEFLDFLAAEFRLSPDAAASKTLVLRELEQRLLEFLNEGVTPALIIDEAQSLPADLLEEVRLLANLETETEKLMPIVLVGQPELSDRLDQTSVRQLKQRVALRCELRALSLNETAAYIATRVRIAGGDAASLFSREAVILIHERARGIPRIISALCHNALISGFALQRRPVGSDIVREVCSDLHVDSAEAVAPPAAEADPASSAPSPPAANDAPAAPATSKGDLFTAVSGLRRRAFFL